MLLNLLRALHGYPLTHLDVQGCSGITGNGIGALTLACPKLTILSIKSIDITSSWLRYIGDKSTIQYPEMKHLNLHNPPDSIGITHELYSVLGKYFPNIEYINLIGTNINDERAVILAEHLTKLVAVEFYGCNIGDKTIEYLIPRCPNLTSINLDTTNITDTSVVCLASNWPSKKIIVNLRDCNITDAAVPYLSKFSFVSKLNLGKCTKISKKGLELILGSCIWLTVLHISSYSLESEVQEEVCKIQGALKLLNKLTITDCTVSPYIIFLNNLSVAFQC